MAKKIVVTGMGAISPIGNSVEDFCAGLKAGKSGVSRTSSFDTDKFSVKISAEVKDFDASRWIERKEARKMARFVQFAVSATAQALKQAGLVDDAPGAKIKSDPERTGIVVANGIGGFEVISEGFNKLLNAGPDRMPPLTVPMMIGNEAAGNISMIYGVKGPALTQVTACASGADGLGQSLDLIRSGRVDAVIAAGTEACITPFAIGGFSMLKTLSTRNDAPEKASRPFDKDRDGFVLGEGAGALILETEEHAKGRGAKILAEFAGYAATADAYHITSPDPSGDGMARAIKLALKDSGLKPEDIGYYNAHGTSTAINDSTETKSFKIAFGDYAKKLKFSSTKSMIGHCVAGGGVLEAIACILAMRDGFFPPTINLDSPDPECDLDYVPNKMQTGVINAAMSGNLGFGGHNGVVVFKKYS
ncbi:MAG: beta-ketoacyl-ACP synthase II [Spirochaetaceae bacterium]|jgi:3-oxoacyl-[acyl-carrier-protein] synthase II|nr:beta-ketoacyl-ACP synthase II [Spirochaetaceae bacterium]